MYKARQVRTTFGSSDVRTTVGRPDVEKAYAVVARNTFESQKCQKPQVLSLFGRSNVEKVHTN